MFHEVRYQTGEVREVAEKMKQREIPQLEVIDMEEFEIFAGRLNELGIFLAVDIPFDKTARDGVKEPEFEFRAAFRDRTDTAAQDHVEELMYIDVYFEAEPEETYDPVGEM